MCVCIHTLVIPVVTTPLYCLYCRVDSTRGQVELSLRLSHTDPAAAKRDRRKTARERAREEGGGPKTKSTSDGESEEAER